MNCGMSDAHLIILTPLDGGHTPDATQVTADCGHECWMAATTRRWVVNPFVVTETVCMLCVDPVEVSAAIAAQGGLLAFPGVRDELARHFGIAEADEVFRQLQVRERIPRSSRE